MIATASRFYDDLDTFFAARGLRRSELDHEWLEDSYDYGCWWMDHDRHVYRLTWIGPTHREEGAGGELYLVRLSGPVIGSLTADVSFVSAGFESGLVELLCVIPPEVAAGSHMTDSRVETLLDGWAADGVCGSVGSIDWVRDRAAEARLLWPDLQL